MASFTTRVELHDATWDDYVRLHSAMKVQGFSRTIKSDDGKTYELPPAEYNYEGVAAQAEVLAKAKAAAGSVKPSFAVFVIEAARRIWVGLKAA